MSVPSTVDMESFLEELGVETFGYNGDELIARCPGHPHKDFAGRPDRTPGNYSINVESGQSHCFSCGFGGSLYWVVAWIRRGGKNYPKPDDVQAAQTYVLRHAGESLDIALKLTNEVRRVEKRRVMDESRLALYTEPPDWALKSRGIRADVAARYGILWDPDIEAWITPIRDPESNKLWGWQAKGETSRMFRNLPPGNKKSLTLFGLRQFIDSGHEEIMLVESPLDTARAATVLYEDIAVSSYGAVVSDDQMRLICQHANSLVLALDNDNAGIKAMMRIFGCDRSGRRRKNYIDWSTRIRISVFNYQGVQEKDLGDMSRRQTVNSYLTSLPAIVRGPKAVELACS